MLGSSITGKHTLAAVHSPAPQKRQRGVKMKSSCWDPIPKRPQQGESCLAETTTGPSTLRETLAPTAILWQTPPKTSYDRGEPVKKLRAKFAGMASMAR